MAMYQSPIVVVPCMRNELDDRQYEKHVSLFIRTVMNRMNSEYVRVPCAMFIYNCVCNVYSSNRVH